MDLTFVLRILFFNSKAGVREKKSIWSARHVLEESGCINIVMFELCGTHFCRGCFVFLNSTAGVREKNHFGVNQVLEEATKKITSGFIYLGFG